MCALKTVSLTWIRKTNSLTTTRYSQLAPVWEEDDGTITTTTTTTTITTIPSGLVAEQAGGPFLAPPCFREFVVFNPDQIRFEYLIAYRRVRRFCDCGVQVMERTVSKEEEDGVNWGRRIHLCGHLELGQQQQHSSRCGFLQMFPLCECGNIGHDPNKPFHPQSQSSQVLYVCREDL